MSSNISVCMCSSIWCMTTLHFATKGWAVQKTLSSLLCSAALTHWISVGQLGNAGQGHFRKLCRCEMRYWGQVLLPHQVSEPSVYPKVAWSPWVKVSERYRVSGPILSSNTLLLPFHGQHSHSRQGNIFHQFILPPLLQMSPCPGFMCPLDVNVLSRAKGHLRTCPWPSVLTEN